jgi:HAD superfamily hydrolase (TIGR01549 family)
MTDRLYTLITNVITGILLLSTSSFYQPSQAVGHIDDQTAPVLNIIFDLGGVLIDTDNTRAFWELGPINLLRYWKQNHSNNHLVTIFYKTLNAITQTENNPDNICDHQARSLPLLMCEWLKSTKSCQEIRAIVYQAIDQHPEWFNSSQEQRMMAYMTRMIFTPDLFCRTRTLIPEGVEFVKECKRMGHRVYILSNWDNESFRIVRSQYSDFFSLFDGIIISGDIGAAKPQPLMYDQFTKQFDPATCIFIDDQPENIAAAQIKGIYGIQCVKSNGFFTRWFGSKFNFASIRKRLLKRYQQLLQAGYW